MSEPDGSDELPAAPAWVGEVLASLREDDPPIPADVAERLDAALALLTPADVAQTSTPSPPPGPPAVPESGDPETPQATVLQLAPAARGARHAAPSTTGHRVWLAAVAAAAVVVLGGLGTVAVLRGGPGSDGGAPVAGPASTSQVTPRTALVASGQSYTARTLRTDVQEVLAAAAPTSPSTATPPDATPTGPLTGPGPQTTGEHPPATVGPAATESYPPASATPAAGCLQALAESAGAQPLVVDEARYDGSPVYVVVFPTEDDPATLDVWVVARTCDADSQGLVTFQRIAR